VALLLLFLFVICNPLQASATNVTIPKWVKVSATIGDYYTTIFGYGPPSARIELTSPRVFSVTYTDTTGYFEFKEVILPLQPQDLCLTAQDADGRSSLPTCFPPPPNLDYHYRIGPILLPPTVSLDADLLAVNQTISASGQTFPRSPTIVTFFQTETNPGLLVKPINAVELPQLNLESDSEGNFSFSLPTVYASAYRFYISSTLNSQPSPRSNPLFFTLSPAPPFPWLILLFVVVIVLLIISALLVFRHRHPRYLPSIRYLPWLPPRSVPRRGSS